MADDLDRYVCGLDKQTEEQAIRELNENPKERVAAMKALRDWILQQKGWLKCPTDARNLLMFLRNKKYLQLKVREKVVRYWTAMTDYPLWFRNMDTRDPKLELIFREGIFIPCLGHDSAGHRVVLSRWGLIDTSNKRYTADDVWKACAVINEFVLMDEQTQVKGFVVVEDLTGFSLHHSAFLGMDRSRKMTSIFTKGYPLRFKGIHTYNNNPVFEALLTAVKPLLSKKVVDRFHFHGKSMASVYEYIDKKTLPVEYLPDDYCGPNAGTVQQCIDRSLAELQSPDIRDYLLWRSSSEFGVKVDKKPPEKELYNESFRKLTID